MCILGSYKEELKRNPRLDGYTMQNLNRDIRVPFGDEEFDGVGICVSINYLAWPVEVLREVGCVLKGGRRSLLRSLIVAFLLRQSCYLAPT
jgi:hypothetical protein